MSMKHIFHVHTHRCGHAGADTDEAYIKRAIEVGANKITFTDHAPFPGDPFTGRMKYEQLQEYITSLRKLKIAYKDVIEVCIGLEIEYLPSFAEYYKELKNDSYIECLVLGQHHCELPDGSWSFQHKEIGLMQSQIEAVKTGYFDIVAHPDRYMKTHEVELARILIRECCDKNIPLEHNLSTVEKPDFWNQVPKNARTIVGYDAHCVQEIK